MLWRDVARKEHANQILRLPWVAMLWWVSSESENRTESLETYWCAVEGKKRFLPQIIFVDARSQQYHLLPTLLCGLCGFVCQTWFIRSSLKKSCFIKSSLKTGDISGVPPKNMIWILCKPKKLKNMIQIFCKLKKL